MSKPKCRSGSSKQIGTISGIQIDRQKIPKGAFWESFDEHSAVEWVAGALLESRYGRTKLESLRESGDDPEFDFVFIDTFHIDKDQSSDIAAFALHNFLHGKHMKGDLNNGCWHFLSVAYVLSEEPKEVVHMNKRKRGGDQNHHEVSPFLRNVFFRIQH
mmetsp:Transcript_15155/g.32895  ORF Transcript_15155/g.32895 Transcript_15155/m.32895 type:complete len:159 (-) Transcript_15155:864-1340(-)